LRRLQRDGLVERRTGGSRRIEYRLTELGRTLLDPIETLTDWAKAYGAAVTECREGT
jgi:DNA-binding HxlR family transcriptional regulator